MKDPRKLQMYLELMIILSIHREHDCEIFTNIVTWWVISRLIGSIWLTLRFECREEKKWKRTIVDYLGAFTDVIISWRHRYVESMSNNVARSIINFTVCHATRINTVLLANVQLYHTFYPDLSEKRSEAICRSRSTCYIRTTATIKVAVKKKIRMRVQFVERASQKSEKRDRHCRVCGWPVS